MQSVPAFSQVLQRFFKWLWDSLSPTAVKTEFQGQFSSFRQWHKIARYVEPLKTIASFKVAKAVIKPKRINKILKSFLRAAFYCFGQKRIRGCQITMGNL